MRSSVLSLILLVWSSTVNTSPEESSGSTELSLGDKVLKKQEECENVISKTVDEILNDEDSDLHDIPTADDKYHECKEELDKLKKQYMQVNHIEKSANSEFFTITLSKSSLEVSFPEEGERKELEFDVNEELCVTNDKCKGLLQLIEGDKGDDKLTKEKFAHCSVLLDDIKVKYMKVKNIDDKKAKDNGGLSIKCKGSQLLMPLPNFLNNVDYKRPHQDIYSGTLPSEVMGGEPQPIVHYEIHTLEDGEHEKHSEEPPKEEHGSSSTAFVVKSNLIYCGLFVFAMILFI